MSTVNPDRRSLDPSSSTSSSSSSSPATSAATEAAAKALSSSSTSGTSSISVSDQHAVVGRSAAASSSSHADEISGTSAASSSSSVREHRPDIEQFGEVWRALSTNVQGKGGGDREPIFYGRSENGGFTLECRSREGLRGRPGVTDAQIKAGRPVQIGGVTYSFDAKDIAERLVREELTPLDKMRCGVIVEALQKKINQLEAEINPRARGFSSFVRNPFVSSASLAAQDLERVRKAQEVELLKDLIGKLSPNSGFVGGHYPGAKVGVNVCDYVHVDPLERVGMIFDGIGHDDPRVVQDQFPIYKRMVEEFKEGARGCHSVEEFREWMTTCISKFSAMFSDLGQKYNNELARLEPVFTKGKDRLNEYTNDPELSSKTTEEKKNRIRKLMPESEFHPFLESVDHHKLDGKAAQLRLSYNENPTKEDARLLALFDAVQRKDYDQFVERLAEVSSSDHLVEFMWAFRLKIEPFAFHTSGPALFFGKIMENPDGQEFLCAVQQQDCCYIMLKSDGTLKTKLAGGECVVEPLDPGDVVFAFSDGIGEFLSLDDVVKIVRENHSFGAAAVENAVRRQLENYSKTSVDDKLNANRKQAVRPKGKARNWDPSGADAGCIDDFSFLTLYAKPDLAAISQQRQESSSSERRGPAAASSSTSSSSAAASSAVVSPASSVATKDVVQAVDRHEGHRLDLDILEKTWLSLHEQAQETEPYNSGNEPMFYGQLGKNGQFFVACATRDRFAVEAKTNKEEITRQQTTRNGEIVTVGSRGGSRTYFLDPQFIAEQLIKEPLTTLDKIRCRGIVEGLQAKVNQLKTEASTGSIFRKMVRNLFSSSQRTQEIERLESLIRALTPSVEYVGGNYAHAQVGVNVCDYVHVDPLARVGMVFDGAGHDNPKLVRDQFPIYGEIVEQFKVALERIDTAASAEEFFAAREQLLGTMREHDEKFGAMFRGLFDRYEDERTVKLEEAAQIQQAISASCQPGQLPISKELFDKFKALINLDKAASFIRKYEGLGNKLEESEILALGLVKSVVNGNYGIFCQRVEAITGRQDLEAIMREFNNLCPVDADKGSGAAAFFAKIIKTRDAEFLYTAQWCDCCCFIMNSDPSIETEWVEQQSNLNVGVVYTGSPTGRHDLVRLKPGDIVFAFSDGIGEFLTKEELAKIVRDNYLMGPSAIEAAVKEELKLHAKQRPDDRSEPPESGRIMAARPRGLAKKWCSEGIDPQCFDDMAFFMLFASPNPEVEKARIKEIEGEVSSRHVEPSSSSTA